MPSWVEDESLWEKAKKQATKEGKRDNWAYIVGIYKKMGGTIKSLHLVLEGNEYEVLGELDTNTVLVKSNGDVVDMPYSDYYRAKRLFKSAKKDLSHLVPKQILVTREGKTFYTTVWVDPNTKQQYNEDGEEIPAMANKQHTAEEDEDYRNKIAQLDADIAVVWQLYTRQTYTSKNLGALAVREGVQNSLDAIKKALTMGQIKRGKLDINWQGDTLTIEDNGIGMDVKTLHTKFLKIGGTTKRGEDDKSTGGFGVAKAVILGCGDGFEIETQNNYLNSANIGIGKIEERPKRQGTKLTIHNVEIGKTYDKKVEKISDRPDAFKRAVLDYLESSVLPNNVDITVLGKKIATRFIPSDKTHRDLSDFQITDDMLPDGMNLDINVYSKGKDSEGKPISGDGYIYIRLNGLTQYKYHLGWDSISDITLDITTSARPGSDDYPFTTSREGLQGKADGVVEQIKKVMNQNPIALGDQDRYVDTIYDANPEKIKEKAKEQERAINESFTTKSTSDEVSMTDMLKILKEFTQANKPEEASLQQNNEGMHVQGVTKQPSMFELMEQQHKEISKKAEEAGLSVDEYLKNTGMVGTGSSATDNPLANAWIVSRNADYKTDFDAMKHLPLLVAWDSICREVLTAYHAFKGDDYYSPEEDKFYPGFILEDKTLAMSARKIVINPDNNKKEYRNYIMINPETLPAVSDEILAGYLRSKACHELAHYLLQNGDGHGEVHSYTREALDDASLVVIPKLQKLVKDAKLTKLVKKINANREKFIKNEKDKEERQKYLDNIQAIKNKFEANPDRNAMVAGFYDALSEAEYEGCDISSTSFGTNDEVVVFSKATPELWGEIVDVKEYNANNRTVTVEAYKDGQYIPKVVPVSGVAKYSVVRSVSNLLKDGFSDNELVSGWSNSINTIAHLFSSYLPAYKMNMNLRKMSVEQRMKALKPYLSAKMKKYANSLEHSQADMKSTVVDDTLKVMEKYVSPDYYANKIDSYTTDAYRGFLEKIYDGAMDHKNKPTRHQGVEEPEDVKNYKSKLAAMSDEQVFSWAKELGITWKHHDNPSINRMRAAMEIRKQVVNKSSVQHIVRM